MVVFFDSEWISNSRELGSTSSHTSIVRVRWFIIPPSNHASP